MQSTSDTPGEVLVPVTPDVAREFNRDPRTIKRWIADNKIGFPPTIKINQRVYVTRSSLEAFKTTLIERSLATAIAAE